MIDAVQIPVETGVTLLSINVVIAATQAAMEIKKDRHRQAVSPNR